MSERSNDAARKAAKRAAERDIIIPDIEDKERRRQLEQDDRAWLQHYFPKVFKFVFTEDQDQSLEEVARAITYGTKKCIAGPRGDGKTSITRYRMLKGLVQRDPETFEPECPFGLYVAASDPKASQSDQAIRHKLKTGCSPRGQKFIPQTPFGRDYPFECAVASYVSRAPSRANNITTNGGWKIHVQWAGDLILPSLELGEVDAKEAEDRWMIRPGILGGMLLSCGITSSVLQGANVLDYRPRAVILDDLDKRESLAVEDGKFAPKIHEIISKTISGMKGQGESMGQVMLCTVTSRTSVAFRYSDPEQEPAWSGERKKRIYEWPDRMDLWDEYIRLWQKGKKEKDERGRTIDPHVRVAHQFYLDNKDEMDRGARLGNYNVHDTKILEDGSQTEVSTLQSCFNFIADEGEEAFKTEYQQEPPKDEEVERLILSAYHVQHNARSGLSKNIVPAESAGIACGLDIKKLGFHYAVLAFSGDPWKACIIDYGFHETKFHGDQLRVEDSERAILNGLHEWREERDNDPYLDMDGREFLINLSGIDQGWKHESWANQPANQFCMEAGLHRFLPFKGWADNTYRKPTASKRLIIGDNCHVSFTGECPHVNWNADHYKRKAQEGFLIQPGQPGSLALFTPSIAKSGRRNQPHLAFAKHITSEVWEERFHPGYRGMVCKFWKDGSQNHYLDAVAQGLVAMSLLGATTLMPAESVPATTNQSMPVPAAEYVEPGPTRAW